MIDPRRKDWTEKDWAKDDLLKKETWDDIFEEREELRDNEEETQMTRQNKIDEEKKLYPWKDMCIKKMEEAPCDCQDTSDSEDVTSWAWLDTAKYGLSQGIPSEDVMVHHPPHYERNGHECIDWIEMALTPEEFKGYLKGCAYKYQWRHEEKGHREQDLQKAQWYLRKLESLGEK